MYIRVFFVTAILFYLQVIAYKPVVIIHGVMTGNSTMVNLTNDIVKSHPGTKVYVTNRFGSWSSLLPMWHQVEKIGKDVLEIASNHPEGIHIIGKY
ncbi:lysosomal thioesterase PPT2 homolog [Nilaparvata lugens]|uniref:lysosomal thioesterase PPT2 homolog n=1 Tax=Nilaparvata lugens TaxID=108931 RepID=UPI00193E9153|nr:lysosomal thioesterase PPT2 homolog [Nilaparvata lugens]